MANDTVYTGRRLPGREVVIAISRRDPSDGLLTSSGEQVRHRVKHSPDGMDWGHGGAGALDCARSLLIAALGPAAQCEACGGRRRVIVHADPDIGDTPYDPAGEKPGPCDAVYDCMACDPAGGYRILPYEAFMHDFVAGWNDDGWQIGRDEILAWLARHGVTAARNPGAAGPAGLRAAKGGPEAEDSLLDPAVRSRMALADAEDLVTDAIAGGAGMEVVERLRDEAEAARDAFDADSGR